MDPGFKSKVHDVTNIANILEKLQLLKCKVDKLETVVIERDNTLF